MAPHNGCRVSREGKMAEPASGYSNSHRFFGDFERADTSSKLHLMLDITRKESSGARSSLENIKNLARGSETWVKVIHSVAMDLVSNEPSRIKHDIEKAGCLNSVSLDGSRSEIGGEATFVNRKLLDSCGYVSGSTEHEPFTLKGPIPSQLKEEVVHQQELGNSAYPLRNMKLEGHGPVTLPALTRQPSRKMPMSGGIPQRMHKESRTKLLELNDVPIKSRRRKTVDTEQVANKQSTSVPDTPPAKKPPATPTVPEYAAGLGFDTPDLPPVEPLPPPTPGSHPGITNTPRLTSPKQQQPPTTSISSKQQPPPPPANFKAPKFSPVQLSIAEEMFREAPHLTQDQKRMIMGFLSGFTENPHPEQGSVVSVPLTKVVRQEQFSDAEGHKGIKTYSIETIFEMNYSTGQWRKLQLKRPIKTDTFAT